METIAVKKWRTDYSSLLKCWSLIKTSEFIKEIAYKELQKFKADDKALIRLKAFVHRNENKTTLQQSISLWNKAIDQFVSQKNFSAAAECLEYLSEIEFKYGSTEQKRESLRKLMRSSKYYKRSSQHKQAIIALKRALTVVELSHKNDINSIVDKYEDCAQLYDLSELQHLAKISRKTSQLFREEKALIKANKSKPSTSNEQSMPTIPVMPPRVSTPSTVVTNYSDSESEDNASDMETMDSKELVQQEIKRLNESYTSASTPVPDEEPSDRSSQMDESFIELNSKELLRKNLKKIMNISNGSEDRIETKKAKLVVKSESEAQTQTQIQTQTRITTEITPVLSETKRKRRPKPKEESEELPEKRIIKLRKLGYNHNYIVDPKMCDSRLLCTLCDDSVLSYRWSIVTDHLESRKHKEFRNEAMIRDLNYYNTYIDNNSNSLCNSTANNNYIQSSSIILLGQEMEPMTGSQCKDKLGAIPADTPLELVPTSNDWSLGLSSLGPMFGSPNPIQTNEVQQLRECSQANHDKEYRSLETPPAFESTSNPFERSFQLKS